MATELKRSNRGCCVENCTNTERSCVNNFNIKFYSFPGKYYEEDRKQQWVLAINRRNTDGSLWQPTRSSRICSEHFVGGKKSDKCTDPGYTPSIFSSTNKVARIIRSSSVQFGHIAKVRKVYSLSSLKNILNDTCDVATQVNFDYDVTSFVFSSAPDSRNCNCKYVECNIGYNIFFRTPLKDVSCGPCGTYISDLLCEMTKQKLIKTKNK